VAQAVTAAGARVRCPEAFFSATRMCGWSSYSGLQRGSRHYLAFDLFGLFCTEQPLVLLLLELRLDHGVRSRSSGSVTFSCEPSEIF
jgi:hypothetical protein